MKGLIEFIKESRENEINEGKDCSPIKINFNGMDNADEIIKSLKEISGVTENEKEVEISCEASVDDLKKAYDIVKKYSDGQRNSSHRSSDEQYAQKTIKFENSVNALNDMITKLETPEEPKEDTDKNDKKEKKCKDGSCDKKNKEEE